MSKHSKLRFLVVLLFAATVVAALVSADIGALAQNANSSTTGDESMQNSNANMTGATRRGRRGRRGRRARRNRAATAAAVAAAEGGAMIDPNGGAAQSGDLSGEQTDLSGTYTGHIRMSGGHDMEGDATLTITGNQFSLESGGMTHNGRVYAVTTRGYTGASFYFPDITNPATNTPVVATVRARKRGGLLWLTPVPGTQTKLTFGSGGLRGPRGRRGRRAEMATPPAEATGDASMTGDAAAAGDASMTAAPRRRRGSRRGRRRAPAANTNANTGDNSNATPPM